jgi:hypothetical protein
MPKMDKTGMILAGGAVGLGLLLLPGFFQKRAEAEGEEDPGLMPMDLPPADLEDMGPDVPGVQDKDKDKKKKVLIAKGMPKLIVGTGQKSFAALSGVGSHMNFPDVDIWNSAYVDVMAEWVIQNPSPVAQPVNFLVSLRQTRDFTTMSFIRGGGWGKSFGRDVVTFEYNPKDGVKFDRFHDAFRESVSTTHGASKGSLPAELRIPAGATRTLLIGLRLPGPGRSKELREFWGANPQFNFRVEPYQGQERLGEHEFKDAFSTSITRPELIALRSTGDGDSPRLTIRSLG